MKWILGAYLAIYCLSFSVLAESTVRYADTAFETAISRDGSNFVDIPATSSGNGSSSSAPVKFYVPIANSDNTLAKRFTLGDPSLYMPLLSTPSSFQAYVRGRFEIDNNDGNVSLYAAIKKSDTEFLIFHRFSEVLSDGLFTINFANICSFNSNYSSAMNCDDYDTGNTGTKTTQIYIFQSTDNTIDTTAGNAINPTSVTGGLFLEIYWATKLPGGASSVVTQNELKKGDKSLKTVFTSTSVSTSEIKTIFACVQESTFGAIERESADLNCFRDRSMFKDLQTTSLIGEGTLRELTNGVTYFSLVGVETVYHVSTLLSNELSQTPLQIEALLAKQQCYILSAGFQEEHFVVDFYKFVRDQFLLKFRVGQSFVSWYYKTAPQYTQYIINSPVLALVIRTSAYIGIGLFLIIFALIFRSGFKVFSKSV